MEWRESDISFNFRSALLEIHLKIKFTHRITVTPVLTVKILKYVLFGGAYGANSYVIHSCKHQYYGMRNCWCLGYTAGPHWNQVGSGSNFLCLHEDPQWKTYVDGGHTGSIYGAEYSGTSRNIIFSKSNNGGNPLLDKPGPCAVCYVGGRSTILMIPARTQCPDGWTMEYAGYVVSDRNTHTHRSNYICWDEAPEVAVGGTLQDQAVIYPVEVHCGTLPCSVYITGRELTCVVCSK